MIYWVAGTLRESETIGQIDAMILQIEKRRFGNEITSVTGREFNRDVGKAKRDAATGPGLITDLGLKITGKEV